MFDVHIDDNCHFYKFFYFRFESNRRNRIDKIIYYGCLLGLSSCSMLASELRRDGGKLESSAKNRRRLTKRYKPSAVILLICRNISRHVLKAVRPPTGRLRTRSFGRH